MLRLLVDYVARMLKGMVIAAVCAALLAVISRLFCAARKRSRQTTADRPIDSIVRLTRSYSTTDPLTFWRDEIRSIAEKYGSPVKAAIEIERSFDTLDFKTLDDGELEALRKYWMEVTDWCGKVRIIEWHKLDPNRRWSPTAWTRLFNVFGRVNVLVQIAWTERFPPR